MVYKWKWEIYMYVFISMGLKKFNALEKSILRFSHKPSRLRDIIEDN